MIYLLAEEYIVIPPDFHKIFLNIAIFQPLYIVLYNFESENSVSEIFLNHAEFMLIPSLADTVDHKIQYM